MASGERRRRRHAPASAQALRSRYAPGAAPDYSHRFHAGNVGDVWKHSALVEVLRRAAAGAGRVVYLDTHAGEGRYPLAPTGEWTEGIGCLAATPDGLPEPVARYLALCDSGRGRDRPAWYPGSPVLALAVLGPNAVLRMWERDARAWTRLSAEVASDRRVEVIHGDGLAHLDQAVRDAAPSAVVALIDPPWTDKSDWHRVPQALARAAHASATACFMLWYPVKSLTRPNAMVAQLEGAGVDGTLAELITTPLTQRRNRLNGSGLLLVRPPGGVREALAAMAPALAERCATTPGAWSFRMRSFVGSRAAR